MESIIHGLNPAQREAVTTPATVVQVLAPPGSGKTKTLTARVAHLIARHGLQPCNVIVCTFTRKAAREMHERVHGFVGRHLARQIKLGTFHSTSVLYLRRYGQYIGLARDFGIADSSDSKAILKKIIQRKGIEGMEPGSVLARISQQKCKGVDAARLAQDSKKVEQRQFASVFREYEEDLRKPGLLDFDDLLLRCCELLRRYPQCVSNVEAVLIDEFQDTNTVQFELMALFAQHRSHITIVGDPDQSIYGWRNAEIRNLELMKARWPDTVTINLEENYRSSGAILCAAQNVIEQDPNRPPKKLQATLSPGLRPVLRKVPTAVAEATWLAAEIKRMIALTGALRLCDFVVLLRSAALSRLIEAHFAKIGMPYRVVGGSKFYDRAEVRLILDYLRVISRPAHSEAVDRIINVPPRHVGDVSVQKLRHEASEKGMSFWDLIHAIAKSRTIKCSTKISSATQQGLRSFVEIILRGQARLACSERPDQVVLDLMRIVIRHIGLREWLIKHHPKDHETRWSNAEELMAQAGEASDPALMSDLMDDDDLPEVEGLELREKEDCDALSIFLANVALATSSDAKTRDSQSEQSADDQPVSQVTISTIHSAKGLEWPVVFIPACYQGSIPHSRADDNDEERRLLYVAMTRAQALLYLSCPMENTRREETTMSSFLTTSGSNAYFEECGPRMNYQLACDLAVVLGRDVPPRHAIHASSSKLERDGDDLFALDGSATPFGSAEWNHDGTKPCLGRETSTIMAQQPQRQGFVNLREHLDGIGERNQGNAISKRCSAEAGAYNLAEDSMPRGRKRQIEGQAAISAFFGRKRHAATETVAPDAEKQAFQCRALQDISNRETAVETKGGSLIQKPRVTDYKVRATSVRHLSSLPAPSAPSGQRSDYGLLASSSPPPAEGAPDLPPAPRNLEISEKDEDNTALAAQCQSRPATTHHLTTVQTLQQRSGPVRRLGAKPGFNGWANRQRR